jgi:hypothetical protein
MNDQICTTELTEKANKTMTVAESECAKSVALVVSNQVEYDGAGSYIAQLKNYKKDLESERKELVDPLNAHVKKINAKFKPHATAIDSAISQINVKMTSYFRAEEQKRLKAEAAAAEKARKEQEKLTRNARKKRRTRDKSKRRTRWFRRRIL